MSSVTRLPERISPVAFFEEHVAPVVFERLDELFPEFGFQRDQHGWRATNSETTRAFFGARAERVVCHQIGGFYVHGQGPVPWLSHIESGAMPRGRDYVDAVRRLAHAAGIDTTVLDQPQSPASRTAISAATARDAWFQHALDLIRHSTRGVGARAYLASRGITDCESIEGLVGVAPHPAEAWRRLSREGHSRDAITASGVLADSRLAGRIVGAWRDEHGATATIWGRSIQPDCPAGDRYLYLRGARRPSLPYLASEATGPTVVMVEGVLDALVMRARGHAATIALGGSSTNEQTWTALSRRGVRHVWLFADHDEAGDRACRAATRTILRTSNGPRLSIRLDDPNASDKGMAALLAAHPDLRIDAAWLDERCIDCVDHETRSILNATSPAPSDRQGAFDAATRFLASLPASHALGRETATLTLASWARVEPSVVHALTHDHEDATSLRTRVARLESSIREARRLIGDARLPAPSRDSPVELGRSLDAQERLTTAFQTLTGARSDLPNTTPAVHEHTEPPPLRERILR